jgi:hypothetical protein
MGDNDNDGGFPVGLASAFAFMHSTNVHCWSLWPGSCYLQLK